MESTLPAGTSGAGRATSPESKARASFTCASAPARKCQASKRSQGRCVSEPVIVHAVVDDALTPDFPLGSSLEVFVRREDAERFIEEVRGDGPELAAMLRVEERELEAGGVN